MTIMFMALSLRPSLRPSRRPSLRLSLRLSLRPSLCPSSQPSSQPAYGTASNTTELILTHASVRFAARTKALTIPYPLCPCTTLCTLATTPTLMEPVISRTCSARGATTVCTHHRPEPEGMQVYLLSKSAPSAVSVSCCKTLLGLSTPKEIPSYQTMLEHLRLLSQEPQSLPRLDWTTNASMLPLVHPRPHRPQHKHFLLVCAVGPRSM